MNEEERHIIELAGTNGWYEYKRVVIQGLADLKEGQKAINLALIQARIDIAMLKLKSAIIGACLGATPGLLYLVYVVVSHK